MAVPGPRPRIGWASLRLYRRLRGDEMQRRMIGLATALLLGAAGVARAHNFTGSNELSGMIGGAVNLSNEPGGAKLFNEYGYRMSNLAWLNLQLKFTFGRNSRNCVLVGPDVVACDRFSGQEIEMIAGVKWKFPTRHDKLEPYAKVGGGLAFMFFPGPDNDGVAAVFRGGGGVKYYVIPSLAVGGEMDLEFGPGFFGCGRDCTDTTVFVGFDIAGGIEWNF